MANKQYLDYEGLATYHSELVKRLSDLEYDPNRMFEDIEDLLSLSKWGADKYGRVAGLKEGILITVGTSIWQLEDAAKFGEILRSVQSVADKILIYTTPESLGWRVVNNVEFDVTNHILRLTK